MKVIQSKILCKVEENSSPTTKIGVLSIPNNDYEIAKVISIGDEVNSKDNPDRIKEGDTIYIYSGAGKVINVDGEKYRVININEIILIK